MLQKDLQKARTQWQRAVAMKHAIVLLPRLSNWSVHAAPSVNVNLKIWSIDPAPVLLYSANSRTCG